MSSNENKDSSSALVFAPLSMPMPVPMPIPVPSIMTEKVPFRLIRMPCCGHLFCNVNHRWPTFCSECGTNVYATIKSCSLVFDKNATLSYDSNQRP